MTDNIFSPQHLVRHVCPSQGDPSRNIGDTSNHNSEPTSMDIGQTPSSSTNTASNTSSSASGDQKDGDGSHDSSVTESGNGPSWNGKLSKLI